MWRSGSGGRRRSFPWGRLRATLLRWTARLCCSWPKRTFDTGLLIQVRITYRSCDWKERGSCEKSGESQRRKSSHLLGWTGQGEEREDRDSSMKQGQKWQRGNEILIHLSCRQIWMQIQTQTQTSSLFLIKTPCRTPRKQVSLAALCDFQLFPLKTYLFTDQTTAASQSSAPAS